eukprot:m.288254 g.288254  ORF g.288254 m.288254 type:complete len:125 (-) comp19959_c0_seq1:67-441(-)
MASGAFVAQQAFRRARRCRCDALCFTVDTRGTMAAAARAVGTTSHSRGENLADTPCTQNHGFFCPTCRMPGVKRTNSSMSLRTVKDLCQPDSIPRPSHYLCKWVRPSYSSWFLCGHFAATVQSC